MEKKKQLRESTYAPRLQKPTLKDPRFLAGILLIFMSILAVGLVLRVGNSTEPYYVAKNDIEVGQQIKSEDLQLLDAKLSDNKGHYFTHANDTLIGSYASSYIHAGEFISSTDVEQQISEGRRQVSISLDSTVAATLEPGDRVDLWVSNPADMSQTYEDPSVVMEGAEVASKTSEESIIGGTGKTAVSLLVTEDALPEVLKAMNNNAKINLIPSSLLQGENQ